MMIFQRRHANYILTSRARPIVFIRFRYVEDTCFYYRAEIIATPPTSTLPLLHVLDAHAPLFHLLHEHTQYRPFEMILLLHASAVPL